MWLARARGEHGFSKRVALKKILLQHAADPRFVRMLVDEAKITVELSHPNIAQVLELGRDEGSLFIAMEYVQGVPLIELMRWADAEGRVGQPFAHAAHIIAEVAAGLEHAHQRTDGEGKSLGIVHRDVTPQNVMLSFGGAVKLVDFGIARAENRLNETRPGIIRGKLRYLAPEIAQGLEPDGRADIFCCGILLFELLTGEALYAPRSDLEAIEMATRALVRSPREVRPDIPDELERIVMRALAKDPADRYPSARALQDDLRLFTNHWDPSFVPSALGELMQVAFRDRMLRERARDDRAEAHVDALDPAQTADIHPEPPPRAASEPPPPPVRSNRPGRAVLGGALVVLVSGIGAFAASRSLSPPAPEAPPPAYLRLEVTPQGVDLVVDGEALPIGPEGAAQLTLSAGEHHVALSAEGHAPLERAVELAPGARVEWQLRLDPLAKAPEPPPKSDPKLRRTPARPARAEPERRRAVGFGSLDVASRPLATVYVDGKKRGRTPVRGLKLPAGRHRLTLVTADGRKKTRTVTVRRGRATRLTDRFAP